MTEATKPVNEYAFTHLKFEELIFSNAKGNVKSRRVKEKTGAILLKTIPAKFVDPAYNESKVWRLSKKNLVSLER